MQLPRSQIQGVFSEFVKVEPNVILKRLTVYGRNPNEKSKEKIRIFKKHLLNVILFKLHS